MLLQELEPATYSIHFGDPRLLDGRIQDVMQQHAPGAPLLKRTLEYQHPEHLCSASSLDDSDCQAERLDSACQQVGSTFTDKSR